MKGIDQLKLKRSTLFADQYFAVLVRIEAKQRIGERDRVDAGALAPAPATKILPYPAAIHEIVEEQAAIDEPVQLQGRPGLALPTLNTTDGE